MSGLALKGAENQASLDSYIGEISPTVFKLNKECVDLSHSLQNKTKSADVVNKELVGSDRSEFFCDVFKSMQRMISDNQWSVIVRSTCYAAVEDQQ